MNYFDDLSVMLAYKSVQCNRNENPSQLYKYNAMAVRLRRLK